jgi:hypothetical protein
MCKHTVYLVKMYSFYLLYKHWLGWISLGHAFIHKIDNDIETFWWIAVLVGLSFDIYWKLFDLLHLRYFLFLLKSLALNVHKMGSQGKDEIHKTSQYHCQFNKCQMIALLNRNSPKLLNIIVNFMNKCMSKRNSS